MIYNHKAVKAIELLILKLLFEMEEKLKISEYILDPVKMLDLVDSYVWNYKSETNIMERINMRQFPRMVYQHISLTPNDFDITKLKSKFDDSSYEIIQFKVGYIGGKINPLNRIPFYNLKTNKIIPEYNSKNFSLLINQKHQEYFSCVYCMEPQDEKVGEKEFLDFFDKYNEAEYNDSDDKNI
jgi:hypothetical protein